TRAAVRAYQEAEKAQKAAEKAPEADAPSPPAAGEDPAPSPPRLRAENPKGIAHPFRSAEKQPIEAPPMPSEDPASIAHLLSPAPGPGGEEFWTRFDERARRAVYFAADEAERSNEGFLGTEHLLLGLLRETECVAAQMLERMGVEIERLRQ